MNYVSLTLTLVVIRGSPLVICFSRPPDGTSAFFSLVSLITNVRSMFNYSSRNIITLIDLISSEEFSRETLQQVNLAKYADEKLSPFTNPIRTRYCIDIYRSSLECMISQVYPVDSYWTVVFSGKSQNTYLTLSSILFDFHWCNYLWLKTYQWRNGTAAHTVPEWRCQLVGRSAAESCGIIYGSVADLLIGCALGHRKKAKSMTWCYANAEYRTTEVFLPLTQIKGNEYKRFIQLRKSRKWRKSIFVVLNCCSTVLQVVQYKI